MSNNTLKPKIAKELANIREKIESIRRDFSDFINMKDTEMLAYMDDLENAMYEQSVNIDSSLADIENALCDLSEVLSTE